MTKVNQTTEPLTFEEILLELPLYKSVDVSNYDRKFILDLRAHNFQIDAYCVGVDCERQSIFKTKRTYGGGAGQPSPPVDWMFGDGTFSVFINCERCNCDYDYYFRMEEKHLMKIGQFPALTEILGADREKYKKLLSVDNFSELRRADGLASHGVGIGAFVYLRRIFERLILDHHKLLEDKGQGVPEFASKHMDEKIGALREILPPALVEHKSTYGILSKGLHELDEKTCLKYFPIVRTAIILILEQDLQAQSTREAETELRRQLNVINQEVASKAT